MLVSARLALSHPGDVRSFTGIEGLSEQDIHKITCENAAKFYNLTN